MRKVLLLIIGFAPHNPTGLSEIMSETWALYIDEEGFAQHWDDTLGAFRGLNALMEAICRIGRNVYPNVGERLFCYQFGDGFLITSDFHEEDLSRPVLIAIAILRHVLAVNRVARACLAEGNVSDIAGCYPREVRDAPDRSHVSLGDGLLITTPVLGNGLLNTVGLGKKGPRGPLLIADSKLRSRLPGDISITDIENDVVLLNWIKGEPNDLQYLQERAELAIESEAGRKTRLSQYVEKVNDKLEEWKGNAKCYLLT